MNRDNSKILSMGKWAWILHKADEIEQAKKGRKKTRPK